MAGLYQATRKKEHRRVPCSRTREHAQTILPKGDMLIRLRMSMAPSFEFDLITALPPVQPQSAQLAAGKLPPAPICSASLWAQPAWLLRWRFYAPAEAPESSAALPAW